MLLGFGGECQEVYKSTINNANSKLSSLRSKLPFLSPITGFQVSQTLATYTFTTPAVDFRWELLVGGDVSVPDNKVKVIYTVTNGKLTIDTSPIINLLSGNNVFSQANFGKVISEIVPTVDNGKFWIEPLITGDGFILHLINSETKKSNVEITAKYELKITVIFHEINTTTSLVGVDEFNENVERLKSGDWEKDIVSAANMAMFWLSIAIQVEQEYQDVAPIIEALLALL